MPLFLLARIADESVALSAAAVGSVVELGPVTPVPHAPAHVRGLCALRSRVLTVIDAAAAIGATCYHGPVPTAVTLDVNGHGYALLLDAVEDVVELTEPEPLVGVLASRWIPFARGLVKHDGGTALLIDPKAIAEGATGAGREAANRTVTAPR